MQSDIPDDKRKHLARFAERLKQLRGERSSASVASELGISPATYSRYESALNYPSEDVAIKICDKFRVTLDWLYRGEGKGIAQRSFSECERFFEYMYRQALSAHKLLLSIGWHPGHSLEQIAALLDVEIKKRKEMK